MPLHETASQGYTVLAFLYAGVISGALYDLLSLLTKRSRLPFRLLGDLLLCLCTAALCFMALFFTHCGEMRLYMFLSLALGSALWRLGVRRLFSAIGKFLLKDRKNGKGSE